MNLRSVTYGIASMVLLSGPALAHHRPCWGAPMEGAGTGLVPLLVLAIAGVFLFKRRHDARSDMSA